MTRRMGFEQGWAIAVALVVVVVIVGAGSASLSRGRSFAGAGLPALASCAQTSALQSVALQFAQAKSVWHVGTNEIVGYTFKEMSGLVANFAASGPHYAIITGGSSGASASVGCYFREDPADLGARYVFCIAQFAH